MIELDKKAEAIKEIKSKLPEGTNIDCEEISNLKTEWYGCYLLYDFNMGHAYSCFDSNNEERWEDTYSLALATIDDMSTADDVFKAIQAAYIVILKEDVQGWKNKHMEVFNASEDDINKMIKEVYQDYIAEQQVYQGRMIKILNEAAN